MNKEGKTYWCPVCETYPDHIVEKYDSYKEYRYYCVNGEYDISDSDYGNCETFCGECDEPLEYREEPDNTNKFEGDRVKKEAIG
jgi:ribosomal protein L44E